jgi:hypothetical protein
MKERSVQRDMVLQRFDPTAKMVVAGARPCPLPLSCIALQLLPVRPWQSRVMYARRSDPLHAASRQVLPQRVGIACLVIEAPLGWRAGTSPLLGGTAMGTSINSPRCPSAGDAASRRWPSGLPRRSPSTIHCGSVPCLVIRPDSFFCERNIGRLGNSGKCVPMDADSPASHRRG